MKLIPLLLGLLTLTAIAGVDPKKAYQEVLEGKAVFVDVREQDEIKLGLIKEAKWFPLTRMKTEKDWKKDFDQLVGTKTIYVYCRTGNRAGQAQGLLKSLGTASENLGGFADLAKVLPTTVSGPQK